MNGECFFDSGFLKIKSVKIQHCIEFLVSVKIVAELGNILIQMLAVNKFELMEMEKTAGAKTQHKRFAFYE